MIMQLMHGCFNCVYYICTIYLYSSKNGAVCKPHAVINRTASRHILDRFMKMVGAIKNNDSSEDFHLSFSFSMRSYVYRQNISF